MHIFLIRIVWISLGVLIRSGCIYSTDNSFLIHIARGMSFYTIWDLEHVVLGVVTPRS